MATETTICATWSKIRLSEVCYPVLLKVSLFPPTIAVFYVSNVYKSNLCNDGALHDCFHGRGSSVLFLLEHLLHHNVVSRSQTPKCIRNDPPLCVGCDS
jgi:hypothetical protein